MKPYYQDEWVTIYLGDCREILPTLEKVDLVLTDPPYNIHKASWDRIPNYIEWCGAWLKLVEDSLADNGSFYFFHNEMPTIAELMCWIKANTKFVFKQFIVWNKRFNEAGNKGFLDGFVVPDGLRNYQQMAEYLLFYTFQDETGLTRIFGNDSCFTPIREYLRSEKLKAGLRTCKQINQLLEVDDSGGGMASHYFSSKQGFKQWALPTKEMYSKLQKTGYFQRAYEDLRREYEDLRREYESLRYTFNNQKTHHSVWNYEIADRIDHATPKPVDLLENIIRHSSNEGDSVLDLFAGSGSTLISCKVLNRKCIGIEIEEKYCEIAVKRCSQGVMELKL